jgi:predicted enzyme related to lactoylglutathione lyase/uncharacterized protein YndB with AHSA1/START domain
MNAGTLNVTTPTDREIVMTRSFDAPRALVFNAMTKPELLKGWLLGPPGWSMVECENDLKVGGEFLHVWRRGDGTEMSMSGTYREIVPPERVVRTESFKFGCDGQAGEQLATVVLTEQDGKTALTLSVLFPSKEARDATIASGMERGVAASYERLAEMLSRGPRIRKPGEFCWINMLTPQPDEAREFFAKLLGWTYFEMPGLGHGMKVGGRDIGGLFDLNGPQTPKGIPPSIGVMVKVESADAICERVTSLGVKVKPAFDIMENLRMAVCFDPNGANFDVWEPKKAHGTDVDSTLHGAPSWFETLTTDVDRAARFYSELFGWMPEGMPMPGATYTTFKLGDAHVAGMMQIAPQMGDLQPHWRTYFTVDDADGTAREAIELGAEICMTMKDAPGVGRFCGITSPQGVTFCVIQYTR